MVCLAMAATSHSHHTLRRAPRHLTLVFDINKSIVMADEAGSKSEAQVCNEIIAEVARGAVNGAGEWVWNGSEPGSDAPGTQGLTYADYVHEHWGDSAAADTAANDARKKMRDKLRGQFCATDSPGAQLAPQLQALRAALRLPTAVKQHPRAVDCGLQSRESYLIIPAYFNLMSTLQQCAVRFSVQFRTFGSDLPDVIAEHNAFCCGAHPLSSRADCSEYQICTDTGCATIFRDAAGAVLMRGLQPIDDLNDRASLPDVLYTEQLDIAAFLSGTRCKALALRDHYRYWRDNVESATSGKLIYIDPDDTENLVLVFDDNILQEDAHIIDARCSKTGEPLAFDTVRTNLVRVDAYRALLGGSGLDNYFLQEIMQRWEGGAELRRQLLEQKAEQT